MTNSKVRCIVVSKAVEDYLKASYEISLENRQKTVSTSAIAERLDVRPASVTGMIKKL